MLRVDVIYSFVHKREAFNPEWKPVDLTMWQKLVKSPYNFGDNCKGSEDTYFREFSDALF